MDDGSGDKKAKKAQKMCDKKKTSVRRLLNLIIK